MKKFSTRRYFIVLVLLLVAVFLVIEGTWWLHEPTTEELCASDVKLERIDRYVLIADSDTVMAFSHFNENSQSFEGGYIAIDSMASASITDCGQWVNQLPGIPSSYGSIAVITPRKTGLCTISNKKIHLYLKKQKHTIDSTLTAIEKQLSSMSYYMRTHTVIEQGFDLVARYDKRIREAKDSLLAIQSCLNKSIKANTKLKLLYAPEFYVLLTINGKTEHIECRISDERKDITILRTINRKNCNNNTRLSIYDQVVPKRISERNKALSLAFLNQKDLRIDSLGTYRGEMSKNRVAEGFGKLIGTDGTYYEGEWKDGKREGLGFYMSNDSKMSVGEWKEDKFLGERMVYSNDRIYGIDISRYQHESSNRRKRYSINWDNLAITSLGTISRKIVHGTIDYPISFIYIKSTEGVSIRNRYYANDYMQARKRGYRVGAYHFFSTKRTGWAQAQYFVANSLYRKGDFPPVLDVEPSTSQISAMGGKLALRKQMKAWIRYVEAVWHVKPVIYVSQKFIKKYLADDTELMENYNFWIARYGEYRPDINLVYWQLCPDGRVRGIHGEVDINVFNGFGKEFEDFH